MERNAVAVVREPNGFTGQVWRFGSGSVPTLFGLSEQHATDVLLQEFRDFVEGEWNRRQNDPDGRRMLDKLYRSRYGPVIPK